MKVFHFEIDMDKYIWISFFLQILIRHWNTSNTRNVKKCGFKLQRITHTCNQISIRMELDYYLAINVLSLKWSVLIFYIAADVNQDLNKPSLFFIRSFSFWIQISVGSSIHWHWLTIGHRCITIVKYWSKPKFTTNSCYYIFEYDYEKKNRW